MKYIRRNKERASVKRLREDTRRKIMEVLQSITNKIEMPVLEDKYSVNEVKEAFAGFKMKEERVSGLLGLKFKLTLEIEEL